MPTTTRAQRRPTTKPRARETLQGPVTRTWETYTLRGTGSGQFISTPFVMADPKAAPGQGFKRTRSTVDCLGHIGGVPCAFDCKQSHSGRLEARNVKAHQVDFLKRWERGGTPERPAVAFLLVEFVGHPVLYAASVRWYLAALQGRAGVPVSDFAAAAAGEFVVQAGPVLPVQRCAAGVPVHFAPAVLELAQLARERANERG